MTQIQLQVKLQKALENIVTEAIGASKLDDKAQEVVRQAVRREARLKSIAIYEYLDQHVFTRFTELEGRIEDLEARIRVLGSAGPTGTPGDV